MNMETIISILFNSYLFVVMNCLSIRRCSFQISKYSRTNFKWRTLSSPSSTEHEKWTSLSFYKFHPISNCTVDSVINYASVALNGLKRDAIDSTTAVVKGTLIVSTEGINGQFCVLSDHLPHFSATLKSLQPSGLFAELDINVGETRNFTSSIEDISFPFKKLVVKRKESILTDGIKDSSFDWTDAGPEIPAEEWHQLISHQDNSSADFILLDCRNFYESDKGSFLSSVPLNTTSFRDSWDSLTQLLQREDRNKQILTFCTGGIRCVKVNAFLKQEMGFQNVGRLEKGIVAYEKWIQQQQQQQQLSSLFEGENFVFDRRRQDDDK